MCYVCYLGLCNKLQVHSCSVPLQQCAVLCTVFCPFVAMCYPVHTEFCLFAANCAILWTMLCSLAAMCYPVHTVFCPLATMCYSVRAVFFPLRQHAFTCTQSAVCCRKCMLSSCTKNVPFMQTFKVFP